MAAWCSATGLPGIDHEFRYHSVYGVARNASAQLPCSIISPMSLASGAKHGTAYGPQWMKIPSLASSYHSGNGRSANGTGTFN